MVVFKTNLTIIIGLFFMTGIAVSVKGQEEQMELETNHLLKDSGLGGVEFSTFYGEIAPSTAFSTINKTLGKVLMSEFGIHLNRKITLGFYMARSPKTNLVNVPAQGSPEYQEWLDAGIGLDQLPTGATQAFVYFSHTGINMAYMHKTERILFWRAGFRLGSGKLQLTAEKRQVFNFLNTSIFEKKVLNINPEVGVGVNLRSWWRLHFDVGYQFVFDSTDTNIDLGDFDGTTFKLGFAFGNFAK